MFSELVSIGPLLGIWRRYAAAGRPGEANTQSNLLKSIAFNTLEGCVKSFSLVLSIQLLLYKACILSMLLLRRLLNDNPRILFGLPPSSFPFCSEVISLMDRHRCAL